VSNAADAEVVARLRAAGAVVVGHTSMTEFGMSPLGVSAVRVLDLERWVETFLVNAGDRERLSKTHKTNSANIVQGTSK
jgi:hypothetical protein